MLYFESITEASWGKLGQAYWVGMWRGGINSYLHYGEEWVDSNYICR
jgi:uncharacterized protein YjlB